MRRAPLLLLLLAGCSGEPEPQPPPPPERPAAIQRTLRIEGTAEPVTLHRYTPPDGFPLPFSTYLSEAVDAEPISSGEGDGVRFVASLGGIRNDDAAVHLFVFPQDAPEERAREIVRSVAESYGPIREFGEVQTTDRFPWAVAAYPFSGVGVRTGAPVVGAVGLGRHAGRWFYLIVQHPEEMGDGFAPRAALILDEWRWADGSGLEPSQEPAPP